MPRWGAREHEKGFLFAPGESVTRSHDPADRGSSGSAEEVIFQVALVWHRMCAVYDLNYAGG
jgi:hypothetical protein